MASDEVSNMYLETQAENTDLSGYESFTEVAVLVMDLLADGHNWVRLHAKGINWATQWTVLERDGAGKPSQVISREFDGETEVLSIKEN